MKRHEIDVFSAGSGGFFLVVALAYGLSAVTSWTPDIRLVIPAMLVALGASGFGAAVIGQKRAERRRADQAEP